MSSEPTYAPALPGRPRWALSGLYAALMTALVCIPAWPGMMSYDSLFAYGEGRDGVTTALWPPMHAYLFWLSQQLGAGAGGLFLLQTFLLFAAAALAINLMVARRAWAIGGLAVFAGAFIYVPELIGSAVVHWRDVTTTSFALAGLAAWLAAGHYRSRAWLALAIAGLGMAAALRYNAVLLIGPLAALMVWRPFLAEGAAPRLRALTGAGLALAMGLAWGSGHWRLPDLRPLSNPGNFVGAQQFDLIGISACSDRVYLPLAMTNGWPISPRQIRAAYDPRHLQLAYRPLPGAPRIVETAASGEVKAVWPRAVRRQFGCYLQHRAAVFVEQMGMARDDVFLPTIHQIDPNAYGLEAAHPGIMITLARYIEDSAPQLWRRPFLLYLLAPLAVAGLWLRRAGPRLILLGLLAGALAYPAVLFVAAPAADARYIFPSSVACALILAAAGAALMSERGRAARRPDPAQAGPP